MRSSAGDNLLASLVQLGNQLRSTPDLDGVVRAIATAASRTFGYNEITIYLRAPGEELFHAHATVGHTESLDRRVLATPVPAAVFEGLLTEQFRLGCAFFIDHREYAWPQEWNDLIPPIDLGDRRSGEWHGEDALFVPLHDHANRMVGVLDLSDPTDRRLPDIELAKRLEVFATYSALAVESSRQYEELGQAKDQLEHDLDMRHKLLRVSESLLSTLDPTAVFEQIADALKTLVDFDCVDISLVDEAARELVTIFAQDAYAQEILDFRVPLDQGVAGWVVRNNQAQLINDMYADPRVVQVPGTGEEQQASILVPLVFMDRVMGVLILDRLNGGTFVDHELEITQVFANLAAIAIRNARSYKEMEVQASTDGLTGLYNHRHFQESLAVEVARSGRYAERFCLLMMDLDLFKTINDSVGHQRGDDVLREVAHVLRRCSRESDLPARYGGEEFAMILPHTLVEEACAVAERIRAQVAEINVGDSSLSVSISIGVASFPDGGDDKDALISAADAALLSAKSRGRNRVCTQAEPAALDPVYTLSTPLAALGHRFARSIGLSDEEATALGAALHVVEAGKKLSPDLCVARDGDHDDGEQREPTVGRLFDALLYANERWDGRGYPEGLHGDGIPAVARVYALLQTYARAGNGAIPAIRARSGKQLDPRLVNRFLSFLAEEARRWSPLHSGAGDASGYGRRPI